MKRTMHLMLSGWLGALLIAPVWAADSHDHDHHQEAQDEPQHEHDDPHPDHEADQTTLSGTSAREAGVVTERAGARTLHQRERLYGRIQPDAERIARIGANYPGEIVSVNVSVGDRVSQGDVLARVRSRESLETYSLTAPLSGEVIERRANPGELAHEEPLFILQDLSDVWVELLAYPEQGASIARGQPLRISGKNENLLGETRIDYVAPHRDAHNQGVRLRATLTNEDRQWAPGQRVTGEVVTDEREVPLAVRRSALQTVDGETVVFVRDGDTYRSQPVVPGLRDGDYVEVRSGLEPGTEYVTENSYLIKADMLKSGASHDH